MRKKSIKGPSLQMHTPKIGKKNVWISFNKTLGLNIFEIEFKYFKRVTNIRRIIFK